MLYNPLPIFNWRNALSSAFTKVLQEAAIDFLAQDNKPWTYYLGSVFGRAAAATGIPGAAAVVYVVGDTLDYYILKTPQGSDVRIFLNGVQQVDLSTYAATEAWELVQGLVLDNNRINEIRFENIGPATGNNSGISWLTLGDIIVNNGYALEAQNVAYNTISYRTKDTEADGRKLKSFPVNVPTGFTLAQYQAWSDNFAPLLDACLDTQILEADLTIRLTLPGGLKTEPQNNVLNERGGLISFDTSGPRGDSVWLPGIARSIMPGDAFSIADTDIAALITALTTATTAANIRPVTKDDYQWSTALAGKKSIRK